MIDPKLNELTDKSKPANDEKPAATTDENASTGVPKPRAGLSINDTIASDANLSVGSRGADTSGVRAGAGAGAGGTSLTAGSTGASPAAQVKPGARGSGSTPLGGVDTQQSATNYDATAAATGSNSAASSDFTHDEIASHAYTMWHDRGQPHGTPEEDWHRAVEDLRTGRGKSKGNSA